MEDTKLMPRHLSLLILPVIVAILGGLILTNSLAKFMGTGSKGISQAELYFALSLLSAALAFSWRYLPRYVTWAVGLFLPLLFAVISYPQLGSQISFWVLSLLDIGFAGCLWLILRFTFFFKRILRMRTVAFSIAAALLFTGYMKVLYALLGQALPSGTFINALFLFIFIGFGLSLADIIIIRQEVKLLREQQQTSEEKDDL